MTVIIGAKHNGSVFVAADNMITDGHRKYTPLDAAEKLLIKDIGTKTKPCRLVAGLAGDVVGIQDVQARLVIPKIGRLGARDYLLKKFVPALKKTWKKDKEDCEILVALHGSLFIIGDDYSVMETGDDFVAIGSGSDVALGAMAASGHIEDIKDRMKTAVAIVARFVSTVSASSVVVPA